MWILLAISLIVLAAIVPQALSDLFNANTSGWSTTAVTLWDNLPLIIVAALLILFVPSGGKNSSS